MKIEQILNMVIKAGFNASYAHSFSRFKLHALHLNIDIVCAHYKSSFKYCGLHLLSFKESALLIKSKEIQINRHVQFVLLWGNFALFIWIYLDFYCCLFIYYFYMSLSPPSNSHSKVSVP